MTAHLIKNNSLFAFYMHYSLFLNVQGKGDQIVPIEEFKEILEDLGFEFEYIDGQILCTNAYLTDEQMKQILF